MTKSVLILPSDEMKMALDEKDTIITEQATALAEKDSTILRLQMEIQRLKKVSVKSRALDS
jgi:hypothetical protein